MVDCARTFRRFLLLIVLVLLRTVDLFVTKVLDLRLVMRFEMDMFGVGGSVLTVVLGSLGGFSLRKVWYEVLVGVKWRLATLPY